MKGYEYYGHESQLYGVEEHRLIGGKGDGMRLLQVKNGLGLEFTVSADRCADISRLSFLGKNYGFFSDAGYVSPAYYNSDGEKFLDSFTAGFLATCGLTNIGIPCNVNGQYYPMHGTIGNTPAEYISYEVAENKIVMKARIRDGRLFSRKLILHREIQCSLVENRLTIHDTVENMGEHEEGVCIFYHMNMGYPLLSEKAKLYIPSKYVTPRNDHSAERLHMRNEILPPQKNFEENCYFHEFGKKGLAAIYNPSIGQGLEITFDGTNLNTFTQWNQFGHKDYTLGLEPGNASVDGRRKMEEEGTLQYIPAGECKEFYVNLRMLANEEEFEQLKTEEENQEEIENKYMY